MRCYDKLLGRGVADPAPLDRERTMKRLNYRAICIGAILVGFLAVALFFWLPRPDRDRELLQVLPPEADLYAVADLESLQNNPAVRRFLSDPAAFSVEEEYKRFVEATGFRYQDHLRRVAAARLGSDWVGVANVTWEREKILRYLESQGGEKSKEQGQTIYSFGRLRRFRLALIGTDLAMFAIGEDGALLRQALARRSGKITDSAVAELDRANDWSYIPKGSAFWAVASMDRLRRSASWEPRIGPFALGDNVLRGSQAIYLSVQSGLLQLDLQLQNRCDSPGTAARVARTVEGLASLLRTVPSHQSKSFEDKLVVLLAGVSVQQVQESVFLRWKWDAETLRKLE